MRWCQSDSALLVMVMVCSYELCQSIPDQNTGLRLSRGVHNTHSLMKVVSYESAWFYTIEWGIIININTPCLVKGAPLFFAEQSGAEKHGKCLVVITLELEWSFLNIWIPQAYDNLLYAFGSNLSLPVFNDGTRKLTKVSFSGSLAMNWLEAFCPSFQFGDSKKNHSIFLNFSKHPTHRALYLVRE